MREGRNTMSDDRTGDFLVAFGIGALVGAVGALLLAPGSGEETRRRMAEFSRGTTEKAKEGISAAGQALSDQGKRLQHAFEEGKTAYQKESSRS
jgi:gas vesicle protein